MDTFVGQIDELGTPNEPHFQKGPPKDRVVGSCDTVRLRWPTFPSECGLSSRCLTVLFGPRLYAMSPYVRSSMHTVHRRVKCRGRLGKGQRTEDCEALLLSFDLRAMCRY